MQRLEGSTLSSFNSLDTKDLLLKVTSIPGPSGYEDEVLEEIKNVMKDYSDECFKTAMGSLVCVKKGKGPNDRFFAHADQICVLSNEDLTKMVSSGYPVLVVGIRR